MITLIKGNPGIGKSVFIYYLLYLFRSSFKDQLKEYHIVYDRVNQDTLFFIYENGKPVAYSGDRKSFGKDNYQEFMKDEGVDTVALIMPLWNMQELTIYLDSCISSINQPDSPKTGSHKVFHIDALPDTYYIQQKVRFGSIYIQEKPEDINFAAVDSFFNLKNDTYLFQMSVSKRHPIALKEINELLFDLNRENNNNSRQYFPKAKPS
eukprot:gene3293-4125_t